MKNGCLWLLCCAWALPAASQSLAPSSPTPRSTYVVGSVHDLHFQDRYQYSLVDLQAEITSLHPDVICGEITP